MMRACNKAVPPLLEDKTKMEEWKKDVRKMHNIPWPFTSAFEYVAKTLFPEKWTALGELRAVAYFIATWTLARIAWARAYLTPGTPSTNNGLERKNRVLKCLQQHRRLVLNLFMQQVVRLLTSQASCGVAKNVAMTATLTHADWRALQVRALPATPTSTKKSAP